MALEHFSHKLNELFESLGLASDAQQISNFIREHSPLEPSIKLEEAPFWNAAQADMLKKALQHDSDWCAATDQLNLALRHR